MEEEIWKDIVGYEGLYLASNMGKIKSIKNGKNKILKPHKYKPNFWCVNLYKNGKHENFKIAYLILQTFKPNGNKKAKIINIDGNSENNKLINLKYADTISYNGKEYNNFKEISEEYNIPYKLLRSRRRLGWTLDEIITIKKVYKNFGGIPKYRNFYGNSVTIPQLSEKYNIPKKNIYQRLSRGWDIYSAVEIPISKNEVKNEN